MTDEIRSPNIVGTFGYVLEVLDVDGRGALPVRACALTGEKLLPGYRSGIALPIERVDVSDETGEIRLVLEGFFSPGPNPSGHGMGLSAREFADRIRPVAKRMEEYEVFVCGGHELGGEWSVEAAFPIWAWHLVYVEESKEFFLELPILVGPGFITGPPSDG